MKKGLWSKIKTVALTDVSVLVRGIQQDTLDELERVLIEADFGPLAFEWIEELETVIRSGKLKNEQQLRAWLTDRIVAVFDGDVANAECRRAGGGGPTVIVMLGVNGVGKTTACAKLAHRFLEQGDGVLMAAADTYRAGASEQLKVWADRLHVPCVTGSPGADPASVAFDAVEAACARNISVVLVDTAGRLHTQSDLMTELQKVVRVVSRKLDGAPHETLLVLDGTVGQNALQQGRVFGDAVPLTGLILTKMEGTATGGAVVPLRRELRVPVRFLGVGETVHDLEPFSAERFAEQLLED